MHASHTPVYGLYQTFAPPEDSRGTANLLPKKDLTSDQKKELLQKFSALEKEQTDAVFMLIIEHARRNGDFEYDPTNIKLPYGLEQKSKTIVFDLKKIPIPLRWVLWRFSNVINKPPSEQNDN